MPRKQAAHAEPEASPGRTDPHSPESSAKASGQRTDRRNRSRLRLLAAAAIPILACIVGLLAPWIAPYPPNEGLDVAAAKFRPPGTVLQVVNLGGGQWKLADRVIRQGDEVVLEVGPRREIFAAKRVRNLTPDGVADSRHYLLGTDRLGRDLLSRLIFGARTSMTITMVAIVILTFIGVLVGSIDATAPAWVDGLIMRGVDFMLTFPWLFVVIILTAFVDQPSLVLIAVVLAVTGWMSLARLLRAEIISLRQREFVMAAESLGLHPLRILGRHLLPNAFSPALVQIFLLCGRLILIETSLSFLGFGVEAPQPSWGNLIGSTGSGINTRWWLVLWPGLAISLTVIGFNFFGDQLRDRLDPRIKTD